MNKRTNSIVIKGDKTYKKEIIKTLEMLGGKNNFKLDGSAIDAYYYIAADSTIDIIDGRYVHLKCVRKMTIDEFYEKYPFKVGEKVKSYFGDWYTRIIEAREIDGEVKYRISNSGVNYFQKASNFVKCKQDGFSLRELEITVQVLNDLQKQYKETNELAYNAFSPIILEVYKQIKNQK